MNLFLRLAAPVALALSVGACSLSSILGGGKTPPTLLTLNSEAPPVGEIARSASAGEVVTIDLPIISKELRTVRIPVQVSPTDVQYVTDVQWVDTPDRLFQGLLSETITRTTRRVVLNRRQAGLDPGLVVSGQLHRFGFDEATQQVVVRYDASLSTAGGTRVETRRFEATYPAAAQRGSVGPALNRAANQVALEVARWISR